MKTSFLILVALLGGVIMGRPIQAKRSAPRMVAPAIHNGVRYTASHFRRVEGENRKGGYVEAWEVKSGKKLWDLKVYGVSYETSLETDVQDVFITSLRVEGNKLIVANESGERYAVDLKTRKINRLSR